MKNPPPSEKSVSDNSDLRAKIGTIMGRGEGDVWSKGEQAALAQMGTPTAEQIQIVQDFYLIQADERHPHWMKLRVRRQTSLSLIENWQREADKARRYPWPKQPAKSQRSEDPPRWGDFIKQRGITIRHANAGDETRREFHEWSKR